MQTEIGNPVQYSLPIGNDLVDMTALVGKEINFRFDGEIRCLACNKTTKKSFAQGFCFPCFQSSPSVSECIIRPELCQGHIGKGRDPEWELKHHVQPHYVYLALSSGLKVGVTRDHQIPTRWIDQGATRAVILAKTTNRHEAGLIEVALKTYLSDKTNWQRMLKNEILEGIDLVAEKEDMGGLLPVELQDFYHEDDEIVEIDYPVLEYPTKIKSIGFDKSPVISGVLKGIKGQYLIFEEGKVMNVRKHSGYVIAMEV